MGREVRMVPANWQHPTKITSHGLDYVPLYSGSYALAAEQWEEERAQWDAGFKRGYGDEKWVPKESSLSFDDWYGSRPQESDYMPDWPADQRTHLMMYENTSEGTPISPAFETPEELARWLADNGASAFGASTATYEQWLSAAKRGYSPSMVIQGGLLESGVAALAE